MTSTLDPISLEGADDPAAVLAYARARKAAEDDAAREVFMAAARWAAMHSGDSLVGPLDEWHESCLPLGGQGCPEVAEFAVVEFAAAMGRSTDSGRRYLSQAVEGYYRLTSCWARLDAGELQAWKLGFIAEQTICLSPETAAFVDAMVAPFAHSIGPAQLGRLIEEAKARFDPEATEAERLAAVEAGHFDIALAEVGVNGRVRVDGDIDLADALDLEAAVAADAHHQLLLGSNESLDVRRALAVGNLARGQQPLELPEGAAEPKQPRKREVVLHVHLEQAAVLGAGGIARLQETRGPITAAQVREWCAAPTPRSPSNPSSTWPSTSTSAPTKPRRGSSCRPSSATAPACSRSASAPPRTATANTGSLTRTAGRPARATKRPVADDITAPRPPAAGPMSPSNPASTCGAARSATSSSETTPAPLT